MPPRNNNILEAQASHQRRIVNFLVNNARARESGTVSALPALSSQLMLVGSEPIIGGLKACLERDVGLGRIEAQLTAKPTDARDHSSELGDTDILAPTNIDRRFITSWMMRIRLVASVKSRSAGVGAPRAPMDPDKGGQFDRC